MPGLLYANRLTSSRTETMCMPQRQGAVPLSASAALPSGRAVDTQSLFVAETPRPRSAIFIPFDTGTVAVPSSSFMQPPETVAERETKTDTRLDDQMKAGCEYGGKQQGCWKQVPAASPSRTNSAFAPGHREAQQGGHPGSHEGSSLASTSSLTQTHAAESMPRQSPPPTLLLSTPVQMGEVEPATVRGTLLITDLI